MKKILIYCRESRDDNFINFERIETQAKMLVDFVEEKKLGEIVDVIIDDNMTGTDFKRLEPIKQMIKNNEFDTFLCKDCSRIGRNLLESLKFIEFLELNNIELLFFSEQYDEDIFPIKAWFNQQRVKDDSKKIKDVLHKKMKDGSLLIKAPFGYNKISNMLEVNEETKETVTLIFKMFLESCSISYIVDYLNENGCKTPSMYKDGYSVAKKWNNQQVKRILENRIYTGDMIYAKKVKKSYKSKKYTKTEEANWIILENHHYPIISKEDYFNAKNLLKKRNFKQRNSKSNIFSGLLYCGECDSIMYRKTRENCKPYYICKNYNLYGTKKCSSKKVTESQLIQNVYDYIEQILSENKDFVINELNHNDVKFKNNDKQIKKLKSNLIKLYDDKLNEKVPEFIYDEKLKEFTKSIEKLETQKPNISYEEFIEKCLNEELTREKLLTLFQKIMITESDENKVLFIKKT